MTGDSSRMLPIPFYFPRRILVAGIISIILWAGALLSGGHRGLIFPALAATLFTLISLRHCRRAKTLQLRNDGIAYDAGGTPITLADVEAIVTDPRSFTADGLPPVSRDAVLFHRAGMIQVPKTAPGRAEWFRELLAAMNGLNPVRRLPGHLREYWQHQASDFGAENILGSAKLTRVPRTRSVFGFVSDALVALPAAALAAALIPGASTGAPAAEELAGVVTGMCLVFGLLAFLMHRARRAEFNNIGPAGIVIGPGGLALQYDRMKGILRWEELTGHRLIGRSSGKILRLDLPGTTILLKDYFDKPLEEIEQAIGRCSSWT